MTTENTKNSNLCLCGCGQICKNKFVTHHNFKLKNEKHSRWKGGRKNHGNYVKILKPLYFSSNKMGYVYEHIYVFQEFYKCCMLDWGHVHHKDRDGKNNNIENLQGMINGQHIYLHHKKDMSSRVCSLCYSNTTYIRKNGLVQWYNYNNKIICHKCYEKTDERVKYKKRLRDRIDTAFEG